MYFNHLEVIVTNDQLGYAPELAEYLTEENRPLFEEDLPEKYQAIFSDLEIFPYPRQLVSKDQYVLIEFNNADEDLVVSIDELVQSLSRMGLRAVAMLSFIYPEDWEGEEGEEDEVKFFLLTNGKLCRVDAEYVKSKSQMTLDEEFENSKDILWVLLDA